jgi:PKD repeat protein
MGKHVHRAPKTVPLALLAALATVAAALGIASPAAAATSPLSFAVIGDVPYGTTQTGEFPTQIAQINADPGVQTVYHLGDISSPLDCSDAYYSKIKSQFNSFTDPMVYTPGDNEWTDCSRATVGAANPLERLTTLRSIFFAEPGQSLGRNRMPVQYQTGFPENVRFDQAGVTFATLHIVGSNNDLNVWSGSTSVGTAQSDEVTARTNAVISHLHSTFAQAAAGGSRAVVLVTQADMFIPGTGNATFRQAFQPIVRALASESLAFGKPVLLINGDTHSYVSDTPLTTSKWRSFYGVGAVPNLSRITIQGGTSEWTKFTVVGTSQVIQVQRIPLGAPPANAAPSASFTSAVNGLGVSVDGSASSDPDGSIASYSWTFGDGATATGATAHHDYAQAGTYPVTLTVQDNQGATGALTHDATVTPGAPVPPPTGATLAADGFGRTVTGGFGTADTGGAWTVTGTAADFSVSAGTGQVSVPHGANRYAYLSQVSSTATDLSATLSFPRPTGGNLYAGLIGRRSGSNSYGARVVVSPTGGVQLQLQRNTDTVLRSATITGLTYASGDHLQIRLQVTGTSPTTIQAKVWRTGTAEPTTWQATTTDTTTALQTAGSIGLYGYLGRTATTNIPLTVDDLRATSIG